MNTLYSIFENSDFYTCEQQSIALNDAFNSECGFQYHAKHRKSYNIKKLISSILTEGTKNTNFH